MVELFDTDRNIWNQFASLPVGVHVLECNMEKVAHIRRIANRYNALYEKTYGRTQHNSGWPVILTNRDFGSGCRLIIVDHTRIFKEEIRMGRPSDPHSLRAIVMEACKKANETGVGIIDIRFSNKLGYIRSIVSLHNSESDTSLKVSKNNGLIKVINPDKMPYPASNEIIMPDLLDKFLKNETTVGFTITDEEYDELKNELQNILNKAKSKRSLI